VVTVGTMAAAPKNKNAVAGTGEDVSEKIPARVSPSRGSDYLQCPAKFYFKSILRLPSPPTAAQLRGTLTHEACERIFDHPRGERSVDLAVSYVRPAWEEKLSKESQYEPLAGEIDEIIADAESMVRGWFGVEDPRRFDPHDRELRLAAEIAGMPMVGILDRVDKLTGKDGSDVWVVSDYKTAAKVPAPNDRFMDDKFFAMEVYAVLFRAATGNTVSALRLIFVAGGTPDSVRSRQVSEESMARTEAKLRQMWRSMRQDAKAGRFACRTQPLCNWCEYQMICPAWNPHLAGAEISEDSL
jgi:putative RecB family exonuclease